jgi:hypothetical protein
MFIPPVYGDDWGMVDLYTPQKPSPELLTSSCRSRSFPRAKSAPLPRLGPHWVLRNPKVTSLQSWAILGQRGQNNAINKPSPKSSAFL